MTDFHSDGPTHARAVLLLAPGAGAPSTTPFLAQMAALLAARDIRVLRFDFSYMTARLTTGKRRPPPRAETLVPEYRSALATAQALTGGAPLLIGGKSMGGRVASLLAGEAFSAGHIAGLVCLGYPFHPPAKPEQLRTAHLEALACPTLIVQGERDPFGSRAEVETYPLSSAVGLRWIDDGDHDLGPRGASGFTRKGNLASAADAVARFADTISC